MPSPHKNLRQNRESRFRASTGVKNCLTRQFFHLAVAGRQRHYVLSHLQTFSDGRTSPYSEPKMLQNTSHALFIQVWITFLPQGFYMQIYPRFLNATPWFPRIRNFWYYIAHNRKRLQHLLGTPLLDHLTACVIIQLIRQILRWTYNSKRSFLLIEHSAQGLIVHSD